MSELIDFYQHEALSQRSSVSWLSDLQCKALQDFMELGFPTRRIEAWKYTSTDGFLKQPFTTAQTLLKSQAPASSLVPLSDAIRLTFRHGVIEEQALDVDWPQGVIVQPLSSAIVQHPELVKPYLGRILEHHEHGFQALNTAMLQSGLFIYLPQGVQIHKPLVLEHWQDSMHHAVHNRHLLVAESQSSAHVIEDYCGDDKSCYFTNTITEIHAGQGASLTHLKIQRESKRAYHVGHVAIKQAADSTVHSHSLSLGGHWVRSDVHVRLCESLARCLLNGIYTPAKGQHIDHHTCIAHEVPQCDSVQDYKGILANGSRAVFNGRVYVAQGADGTTAQQQNKNILLGEQAEIDTLPQLDIYADDVVCTHGATVGQLDEEALFYFATRGIEHDEAARYLVQAFAADNLKHIANDRLTQWMTQLVLNGCSFQ